MTTAVSKEWADDGSERRTPGGSDRRGGLPLRRADDPPAPDRASDVAQETFQHVFEVDPRLMDTHVLQQVFPNWDTLRIMRSRHDHLDWMHAHFARKVVAGSQLLAEISAEGGGSPEETPDG